MTSLPSRIIAYSQQHVLQFDITRLYGTWQIAATTLPWWRNKYQPCVTYARQPDQRISDIVTYVDAGGRTHTVCGIDTQDPRIPHLFHWRGARWYSRWLSSDWIIISYDAVNYDWLITYFSATLFTSAGFDIYRKDSSIDIQDSIHWLQDSKLLADQKIFLTRVKKR
jgi:hypothetical protein